MQKKIKKFAKKPVKVRNANKKFRKAGYTFVFLLEAYDKLEPKKEKMKGKNEFDV